MRAVFLAVTFFHICGATVHWSEQTTQWWSLTSIIPPLQAGTADSVPGRKLIALPEGIYIPRHANLVADISDTKERQWGLKNQRNTSVNWNILDHSSGTSCDIICARGICLYVIEVWLIKLFLTNKKRWTVEIYFHFNFIYVDFIGHVSCTADCLCNAEINLKSESFEAVGVI